MRFNTKLSPFCVYQKVQSWCSMWRGFDKTRRLILHISCVSFLYQGTLTMTQTYCTFSFIPCILSKIKLETHVGPVLPNIYFKRLLHTWWSCPNIRRNYSVFCIAMRCLYLSSFIPVWSWVETQSCCPVHGDNSCSRRLSWITPDPLLAQIHPVAFIFSIYQWFLLIKLQLLDREDQNLTECYIWT